VAWSAGRRWGFYPVGALQIAVCLGTVVGSTLLGGESMQVTMQLFFLSEVLVYHLTCLQFTDFKQVIYFECFLSQWCHRFTVGFIGLVQIIYLIYKPNGLMQLYEFTIIFGALMLLLSQLPSFHSLRYINLASLVCCLGFSLCVVGGSIYVGRYRQDLVNLYLSIWWASSSWPPVKWKGRQSLNCVFLMTRTFPFLAFI
jgi:hypothetical protein